MKLFDFLCKDTQDSCTPEVAHGTETHLAFAEPSQVGNIVASVLPIASTVVEQSAPQPEEISDSDRETLAREFYRLINRPCPLNESITFLRSLEADGYEWRDVKRVAIYIASHPEEFDNKVFSIKVLGWHFQPTLEKLQNADGRVKANARTRQRWAQEDSGYRAEQKFEDESTEKQERYRYLAEEELSHAPEYESLKKFGWKSAVKAKAVALWQRVIQPPAWKGVE